MRRILILVISILFLVSSCDEPGTSENGLDNYNIPGFFGVRLQRTHESGKIIGDYLYTGKLDGAEITLLKEGKPYKTTHPVKDDSIHTFFNFKGIDTVGTYQLHIKLNESTGLYSEEYQVSSEYFMIFDSTNENLIYYQFPHLFNTGEFYYLGFTLPIYQLAFDFYEEDGFSALYPNPISDLTSYNFRLYSESEVEISVTDYHFNEVMILLEKQNMKAGDYRLNIDCSELEQGLYFMKSIINGEENYTPFEVRRK